MSQKPRVSTKKLVSRELAVFWGAVFFWGGIEIVFLFIVVPCRPKSQKPRDVDKKTPSWVFFVWTELGIFGAAEYFRVGWRKFSHL